MAIDDFSGYRDDQDDPLEHAFAITPHATNELDRITRAIHIGTSGDLVCRFVGDTSDVTIPGAVGFLPFRLSHVRDTSTAAGIVGFR